MTADRPLGTFSDELDRMYEQIVARLDRTDEQTRDRQTEIIARFDRSDTRIDGLTQQVTTTNGSVRDLQKWRSYMEGMKAGAGGSWHLLIGAVGILGGLGGLLVALLTVAQHTIK